MENLNCLWQNVTLNFRRTERNISFCFRMDIIIILLGWDTLEKRRRSHRLFLVFKSLNGLIDWNFNFNHFKDIHDYNTRFSNNICKPQSKRSWGQHRFICHAVDDWNALPDGIRNISNFLVFRRLIRNM